jgi:hypothetical protein
VKTLSFSLKQAAQALGIHEGTLAKNLVKSGVAVEPHKKYTLREVFLGYQGGDLKVEQTRKTRAEADSKELENRVRLGELIEVSRAKSIYGELLSACKTFIAVELLAAGAECTPSNPEHGRSVMEARGRQFLERVSKMEQSKEEARE